MDFEVYHKYPPGDPTLVEKIVCHLKAQGIFDNFRKECLSDVDTKPAYQNLRQRVDGSVAGYLAGHKWKPDLNKNQLRESLRKYIQNGGFLEVGVERIVDQVVNPKIGQVFLPRVRNVVFEGLGLKEDSDNNASASDKPASTSYMASCSATSSAYTSASICNQIDDSKEKADLEKEVVSSIDSEVKKEDNESATIEISEEIVASIVELDPVIKTEETVIKLETRSNDSCDSRISGISDLTSVKSNASDDDNNLDKSPNTDVDEEREDQEGADKSMTCVNEDDENSQDKSEMPSNVIHETTFSNLSFSSDFTTQIENVEIETDQIGTSVVECVTTENNEQDTDGRDSPNLIAKSIEPNFDSDSNGKYEKEIEVHESTQVEYDYSHDKEYYKDDDHNVYEESSRGLHSDPKEESHFEGSQSETDVERFDSTSNEMRFSENANCFEDGKLEQSSEDERFKSHSSKEQEETEKERKYRKDQQRKHHSKYKDRHSSSGETREDRKHRRSKDKHSHKINDDSHSFGAEGKSRKTYDHSDSKHRRSRRGEEEAAASIYLEETSRSETDTKNKYEENVKKSHKSSRSRDSENVYEENTYNEDEESKSECDEKNRYKNSQDEKYSSSRDRKKAKKHETRDYEYGDTTTDHEEASKSESDEINKYRNNPEYSQEESPTNKRKRISEEDHDHEERTSDHELASKNKSKEKNKFQEQVKYSHEERPHTHSREGKKASKTKTHEYEEETTFDCGESRKSKSDEKNIYKDKAEFYNEETPTRRRVRKKAFKEDYEYGEITSDYEEACKSESEEKSKYQEKVKYSHEKSNSRSRDRKKASKVETHDYEYEEETTFDHEESSKSESDEKNTYKEKTKFSYKKKDTRSRDRKKATKEESNKFENNESAFYLRKQSKNEFDEENQYQEENQSQKERRSRSKQHKNARIEKENEDEYEKARSDGEETGKSESEEKNRNQEKLKMEKHSRSREYEMSHDDEQEDAIFDGEGTSKGKSGEKKKYKESKSNHKERHSRSQDKKRESNVRAHEYEYEETILGQQEGNESEIDIENQNQEVEKSREESRSQSRDHKHVSKERVHDGDYKRKKEEQSHHRSDSEKKKHDSSSKNEHSTTQDDVKKDRSHKTSSREHRSSHRSSRDKHAENESENYDQEKHKRDEDNDDKSKKDRSKSRKSRDSCKPADKSREQRRSADGDSSGTGDSRSLGGASASTASSRHTRSQRTKTKENRSGGKGSHSSTSDAALLEDSQDHLGQNNEDKEEEYVETVVQSSLPTNDNRVHSAVSEDDSNTSVRIISEGNEDTQICQETTENEDGEKADDAATKEQETPKRELDQLSTEYIENRITSEFEGPNVSNNEVEQQKELKLSTINSPINSQENSENKENYEENSKSNYQVSETDILDNTVVQQDGETKSLRGNEEMNNDQLNPDISVTSQNIETQLPKDDGVIFRKKKTAENMTELRKIMRERRRNQRIQKKRLSMGDSAAKHDHSPMTNQCIDNSPLEENGQVESLTSVECNKEIEIDKVPERNESSLEISVKSTGETVQNTDCHPLPKVEVNSCNYKRPKVAANIFEVRKIIKARKRLRRIEEKKRLNFPHLNSNKQSLEGESKIIIEVSKENKDEIHENCSTNSRFNKFNKSRSYEKKRDNERPVFGKHSKRDSKGRFAKKVSNEPESDSTHDRTENKTANLITLKIKSQECVGNETKNFECKSSLSYQDINQLASKCLVVKLKKLDETNFKKNPDEVTDSVESLSADKTESELLVQNNENEGQFLNNIDTITSSREVIEQKLHSADARQVEEADLSIRESEIADNNCGPSKPFTEEGEKNRPHRQSETSFEVPDSDELDEQFTHEKIMKNSTEVKNSSESGPIVLEDYVIGSRSCEIPKSVANVLEIENTSESIVTLNDSKKSDSDDIMQSIEEVKSLNSSEILEERIQSNSSGKLQTVEEVPKVQNFKPLKQTESNDFEPITSVRNVGVSSPKRGFDEIIAGNENDKIETRVRSKSKSPMRGFDKIVADNENDKIETRSRARSKSKSPMRGFDEIIADNENDKIETRVRSKSKSPMRGFDEIVADNENDKIETRSRARSKSKSPMRGFDEIIADNENDKIETRARSKSKSPMRGFDEIIADNENDKIETRARSKSKSPMRGFDEIIADNENDKIDTLPHARSKSKSPMKGFDEIIADNENDKIDTLPRARSKSKSPMRGFDEIIADNENDKIDTLPHARSKSKSPMKGFDEIIADNENDKIDTLPHARSKSKSPMRGFDEINADNENDEIDTLPHARSKSKSPMKGFDEIIADNENDKIETRVRSKSKSPMRGFDEIVADNENDKIETRSRARSKSKSPMRGFDEINADNENDKIETRVRSKSKSPMRGFDEIVADNENDKIETRSRARSKSKSPMRGFDEIIADNENDKIETRARSKSKSPMRGFDEIVADNENDKIDTLPHARSKSKSPMKGFDEIIADNENDKIDTLPHARSKSKSPMRGFDEIIADNENDKIGTRSRARSKSKSPMKGFDEIIADNENDKIETRARSKSKSPMRGFDEIVADNENDEIDTLPHARSKSKSPMKGFDEIIADNENDKIDTLPHARSKSKSPMRGFDIDPDETIAFDRKDPLETRPRARSKSPYEPNNKYIENENGDILGFLDEENPRHRESKYFNKSEIENAREKLEKFKTILNTYEKEYKDLTDLQKTEFVTSDFALDKKFDSYLEKECGIQVLRKDCIILPSLNDENYFFDKESGCYYLKNRLVDRSNICKKKKEVKGTSLRDVGKNKVAQSGESSGCFAEKRSVRGKSVSKEQRTPVKLRISIRNPNSSAIETEEINVLYTSDVESSTDGSAGRISVDSRKSIEDAASESELNKCDNRVLASTPLQDDDSVENGRVQPFTDQVSLLKNSSKSTKKKRSHSHRKRRSNSSTTVTSQVFKIKTCPEAENNNLPSAEGAAHLSPFKITLSRNLSRIIAPQSPSSQSNIFSMGAAVPSESESRFVVGKRHNSKIDSVDDGSCSPKKKFHSSVSDTVHINVDQAIETVTDSLDNSFEEEADEGMASNMISEALKNLIAESGLATTTQSPPSYQETKEPAPITKHQRNQKLIVEHENTVSPPKKIRNSERLSAGVRLPNRYKDADLYKPRLDFGQGNRRKRKQDEPVIDSLVEYEGHEYIKVPDPRVLTMGKQQSEIAINTNL